MLHGFHVEHRLVRVGGAHGLAQRAGDGRSVAVGFHREQKIGAGILGEGKIERLLFHILLETLKFDRGDDADDAPEIVGAAAVDAFAERVLAGPVFVGEHTVDDADFLGARGIGIGE